MWGSLLTSEVGGWVVVVGAKVLPQLQKRRRVGWGKMKQGWGEFTTYTQFSDAAVMRIEAR